MSTISLQRRNDISPSVLTKCYNCLGVHHLVDLQDIQDFEERVIPGEEIPAGECPHCGALAYIIKPGPVAENPVKEDFTGDKDRRQPEAAKGMEARPVGKRVRYLAARAELIDLIVEARTDQTEAHEMKDLASHLIEKDCMKDSDEALLEEAEFLEISLGKEILAVLK